MRNTLLSFLIIVSLSNIGFSQKYPGVIQKYYLPVSVQYTVSIGCSKVMEPNPVQYTMTDKNEIKKFILVMEDNKNFTFEKEDPYGIDVRTAYDYIDKNGNNCHICFDGAGKMQRNDSVFKTSDAVVKYLGDYGRLIVNGKDDYTKSNCAIQITVTEQMTGKHIKDAVITISGSNGSTSTKTTDAGGICAFDSSTVKPGYQYTLSIDVDKLGYATDYDKRIVNTMGATEPVIFKSTFEVEKKK